MTQTSTLTTLRYGSFTSLWNTNTAVYSVVFPDPAPAVTQLSARPKLALLKHTRDQLSVLAKRQNATNTEKYNDALAIVNALIEDDSPTPQVSDNGEDGVLVEWIVGGSTLTLDYDGDELIYLIARDADGKILFETETKRTGFGVAPAMAQAKVFLRDLAKNIRQPIALAE